MFDSIISKIVLGWIRHFASGLGGWMLAQGFIDKAQNQQFTGALMVIVPILFSAYDKWQAQQKANAAILAAAQKGK